MSSVPIPVAQLAWPRAWWLALAFLALNLLLLGFGGDFWIADHLYALQGHAWRWRHAYLTESVMHLGGRRFSALAWLLVLPPFALLASRFSSFAGFAFSLALLALMVLVPVTLDSTHLSDRGEEQLAALIAATIAADPGLTQRLRP